MRIPPHNIVQDKHHNITTCLRCYALDLHFTSNCPKNKDYKICSECNTVGHTWRDCPGGPKNCINCGGEHSTMAMSCKNRKEILTQKRKEEKEGATTFSGAVKKNISYAAASLPSMPTSDTHITINQCMWHAHHANAINPGSYEREVNKMFKANNLPELKVPDAPPSDLILAKMTQLMTPGAQTEAQQHQKQQHQTQQRQGQNQTQHQQKQQQQQLEEETNMEIADKQIQEQATKPKQSKHHERRNRKSLSRVTGSDIGLKILTTKSKGWVETPMRKNALLKGIEDKIIKWTYTDPTIKEKEITEKLVFGQIDLTDCFYLIEDDTYSKIKTGLIEERSPPPRPEKQRKEII